MKCRKCGTEFTEGVFCPECGEKYVEIVATKKKCKKCGAEFEKGDFCPECGQPYTEQSQKGVAQTKKAKNAKNTLPTENVKKKSKLPFIIGAVVVVLLALVLLAMGSGSSDSGASAGTDLSEYLPKGKDDVMKLISKAGLNEETPGFYTGEDLRITLDDSGLIDTMTLKTPKYSLYGIKVGDEYQYDHFFDILSDHSYVSIGEDDSNSVWGITSGDQDRQILFSLYSGKIDSIYFMRHGAYEQVEMNQMAYEMDTLPEESYEMQNSEEMQAVVNETVNVTDNYNAYPDNNGATNNENVYGVYSHEGVHSGAYAEMGHEIDTDYDFVRIINRSFSDDEPDETFYYQLYTEDNESWYGVDSKCAVYFTDQNEIVIRTPDREWSLEKQPEGTQMPTVYAEIGSATEYDQSDRIINPDYMSDPGSYLCSWSDSEYMTEDQLQYLDYYGARLVKNEIFARHGRRFSDEQLQEYFNEKTWYEGTISPDDFNDTVLNEYEKANIKVIDSYMEKHQVQ